jgi:vancomycin resistance protein VanJ
MGMAHFRPRKIKLWLSLAFLVLVSIWWFLAAISGDALTAVRWANYATPWIGMSLLSAGAVLFAFGLKKMCMSYWLVALIVLGPYHSQLGRAVTCALRNHEAPPDTLQVLSYNLMTRSVDMKTAARLLREHPADLIFLQEVGRPAELVSAISGLYGNAPIFIARGRGSNLMIISRFPLREKEANGKVQNAVLITPKGEIVLRNLHLEKAIDHDELQQKQMAALSEEISRIADPVIVAGDFNQTQNSDGYRMLRNWLFNVHEESGVGFGFTFPTPTRRMGRVMPFIRIDHIFVSRHFSVNTSKVHEDFGPSDHFPTSASLTLR